MKKNKTVTIEAYGIFWKRRNIVIEGVAFGKNDIAKRVGVKHPEDRNTPIEVDLGSAAAILTFSTKKSAVAYVKSTVNPRLFTIRPMTVRYTLIK